jgi:hypothetical protein
MVWCNTAAGDILKALLAAYTPHFVDGGHLESGVTIAEFAPLGNTLYEACSDLAQRSNYLFFIAPNREISFQRRTIRTAAWHLDASETFGGLTVQEISSQIKNRIAVYYSELQEWTESFSGDGSQTVFPLERAPHEVSSLQVTGADVSYGTRYAENNEANDFSINFNEGEIHTQAHETLESTDTLTIAYTAKVPALLIVNHADSQADHSARDGGDGIYDFEIHAEDEIFSLADAQARADAELAQYAYPQVTAAYDRQDYLYEFQATRLHVGQQQLIRVRGRDVTLTVERVTISVAIPQQGHLLKFLQHVDLGPAPTGIESVFREMQSPVSAIVPEITTIREV